MSARIETQIREYGGQLFDETAPVGIDEIARHLGSATELPEREPQPRHYPRQRLFVVALAAAAVVLVIGLVPILINTDEQPASSTTSVVPTTTLAPSTTVAAEAILPEIEFVSDSGWRQLPAAEMPGLILGKIGGDYVGLTPGMERMVWDEGPSPIDLDGDPRAWLHTSSDGITWTRRSLPEFDGKYVTAGVSSETIWLTEGADGPMWRSTNGENWDRVVFEGIDTDTAGFYSSYRRHSVVGIGSSMVVAGFSPTGQSIWVSTNEGRRFVSVDVFGEDIRQASVTVVGGSFVAIAVPEQGSDRALLAVSENGERWGSVQTVPFTCGGEPCGPIWDMTAGMVDGESMVALLSESQRHQLLRLNETPAGVEFEPVLWQCGGLSRTIDPLTGVTRTSYVKCDFLEWADFAGGRLVSLSAEEGLAFSSDGTRWARAVPPISAPPTGEFFTFTTDDAVFVQYATSAEVCSLEADGSGTCGPGRAGVGDWWMWEF